MLFLFLSLLAYTYSYSSQLSITYRQATIEDFSGLLALIHTIGQHDTTDLEKVVKLPNRFIDDALKDNITKKSIFIALDNETNTVVGYKKLYIIDDSQELDNIMHNEIRCIGNKKDLVDYALITNTAEFSRKCINNVPCLNYSVSDLYIYTGADYVAPLLRNKGIGNNLYSHSLNHLCALIQNNLLTYKRLICLYGLSQYNDFASNGSGKSRTSSIVRSIINTCTLQKIPFAGDVEHYRFKSFMPKFIDSEKKCLLLPDSEGISGFGNVLLFTFKKD